MRETSPVILRPALRQETKTRRIIVSLFRKTGGDNAPGMDRRIVLLALLFPALLVPSCSKFAGNLPKPDIVVSADGSGDLRPFKQRSRLFPPSIASVWWCSSKTERIGKKFAWMLRLSRCADKAARERALSFRSYKTISSRIPTI